MRIFYTQDMSWRLEFLLFFFACGVCFVSLIFCNEKSHLFDPFVTMICDLQCDTFDEHMTKNTIMETGILFFVEFYLFVFLSLLLALSLCRSERMIIFSIAVDLCLYLCLCLCLYLCHCLYLPLSLSLCLCPSHKALSVSLSLSVPLSLSLSCFQSGGNAFQKYDNKNERFQSDWDKPFLFLIVADTHTELLHSAQAVNSSLSSSTTARHLSVCTILCCNSTHVQRAHVERISDVMTVSQGWCDTHV